MISRVFFMGIILAPLAVVFQLLFREGMEMINPDYAFSASVWFYAWAAFVEEIVKFLAVKFIVLHDPEFDEPVDAMVYMVAAALGFAAIENILMLFKTLSTEGVNAAMQLWVLRFIGATLLHAIASSLVGYFLALSWFYHKHSQKLIPIGIIVASFFHFVFNIILLRWEGDPKGFLYSTLYLIPFAIAVAFLFIRAKKRQEALGIN
jgi:RsiW-degrading membrane proteinase PrsW (M82 family)